MAVIYLTFDSEINLDAQNDDAKSYKGKLGPSCWTIAEFQLEKNELKIYHNEFLKGEHYVEGGKSIKYFIKGVVKMTVKPKVAELLLSGRTNWKISKIKVSPEDDSGSQNDLLFVPSEDETSIPVHSTLEKPSK